MLTIITFMSFVDTFNNHDVYKYNMDYRQMADFLGLKSEDALNEDVAKRVSFLRDFTGQKNETAARIELRKLAKKLGIQAQGKELVTELYKFARLAHDKKQIEQELKLMKK